MLELRAVSELSPPRVTGAILMTAGGPVACRVMGDGVWGELYMEAVGCGRKCRLHAGQHRKRPLQALEREGGGSSGPWKVRISRPHTPKLHCRLAAALTAKIFHTCTCTRPLHSLTHSLTHPSSRAMPIILSPRTSPRTASFNLQIHFCYCTPLHDVY